MGCRVAVTTPSGHPRRGGRSCHMRADLNRNGATPVVEAASSATDVVPVVKADTAMTSLRASGHDFNSAVGEVIDNSLEAAANVIRIRSFTDKKKIGANTKVVEVIDRV